MKKSKFNEKEPTLLSSIDLKMTKYRCIYWVMFGILCVLACVCIFPILWVFMSAFKDLQEFLSVPPTLIPHSFHPEKVLKVWKSLSFGKYYYNSLVLIVGNLVCCIFFNGVFGYVISRLKPKGYKLAFLLVFWTMLIPHSMNMVPLYMSFVKVPLIHINITNTFLPMFIMAGANAYETLLFKNFFDGIPDSYIEAAKLDGCTNLGIFFRIIIPISKPILMVVSIFSVQGSWGAFFWPYLTIQEQSRQPVAVLLYTLGSGTLPQDQYVIVLMFAIIPVLIIFSIFSKYILGGSNMSGVKG